MGKRPSGLKYNIVAKNNGWFLKGHNLNKNRKLTDEHKNNLSKSHKGIKKKGGYSFGLGKNNPRWSGAMPQTLENKEKLAGRKKPERCEICGAFGSDFKKGLCFDHNHETNEFRGWICMRCNFAIGLAKDSSQLLRKMAENRKDSLREKLYSLKKQYNVQ